MLKQLTVAALASVMMVSAIAQTPMMTTSGNHPWRSDKEYFDPTGKPLWEQEKYVGWAARKSLFAGDLIVLIDTIQRAPMSVESALVHGLCNARQQAIMIDDRMLAMRFPMDSMTTMSTTTNPNGTAITTTTTTTNDYAANIDWSSVDSGARPMRLIMTNPIKPKDVSYDDAISILCSRDSGNERGVLSQWWYSDATEGQKDAIVRFLKADASIADDIYYPSLYVNRTYSWVNQ